MPPIDPDALEALHEWMAAHDASMKRKGAAEVWDAIAATARALHGKTCCLGAEFAEDKAARLRAEGGR